MAGMGWKKSKRLILKSGIAAMLSVLVLLSGCAAITGAEPVGPSVKIIVPSKRTTEVGLHGGGMVTVAVEVENFTITDDFGSPNKAGEGHIHFFQDVQPPVEPGRPAVTREGTYAESADTAYFWPDPGTGTHTYSVELVNNDHTPLEPPVLASVTVTTDDLDIG